MNIHTLSNDPKSNPIINIYQPANQFENTNNSSNNSNNCRLINPSIYKLKSFCSMILIINALMYIIELLFFYLGKKSWFCTLYYLGAKETYAIIKDKQVFRLLTSTILHASIYHLIMNSLSIFLLGYYVEERIGLKKIIILYISSGILSSIFSAAFNINSLGVGASGSIMSFSGLLIIDYILNYHFLDCFQKQNFLFFGILTLMNLFGNNYSKDGNKVDNFAHLSGFLTGVCLSLFLFEENVHYQNNNTILIKRLKIIFGSFLGISHFACLIYLYFFAKIILLRIC